MSRLDRTGEPVDDEPPEIPPHRCDAGWIDRDADPPLRPCLICKPHLAPAVLRRALADADELRSYPPVADDLSDTQTRPENMR